MIDVFFGFWKGPDPAKTGHEMNDLVLVYPVAPPKGSGEDIKFKWKKRQANSWEEAVAEFSPLHDGTRSRARWKLSGNDIVQVDTASLESMSTQLEASHKVLLDTQARLNEQKVDGSLQRPVDDVTLE